MELHHDKPACEPSRVTNEPDDVQQTEPDELNKPPTWPAAMDELADRLRRQSPDRREAFFKDLDDA
jgi:hypothetical protein